MRIILYLPSVLFLYTQKKITTVFNTSISCGDSFKKRALTHSEQLGVGLGDLFKGISEMSRAGDSLILISGCCGRWDDMYTVCVDTVSLTMWSHQR